MGKMRQRDGGPGLRTTGNVPELRGRSDSDQHFRSAASVHTHAAAVPQQSLQFGFPGRRPEDSAADLLPTCGQVRHRFVDRGHFARFPGGRTFPGEILKSIQRFWMVGGCFTPRDVHSNVHIAH